MIFATYRMIADNETWLMLEEGLQPFHRLVEEHVLREMRRHSSFNDKHVLTYKKLPFPNEGYCVLEWEASAV